MRIRALIVDDEESSRINLINLIEEYCEFIDVVATANSVNSAAKQLSEYNPDVVFLDINMPRQDGFELLTRLKGKSNPLTVFVTAYSEYAIKAIKFNAFYYILKPIDIDELQDCEKRLFDEISKRQSRPVTDTACDKISVSDARGIQLIDINDIIYLLAENNYTIIIVENEAEGQEKIVISKTLGDFEGILPASTFFRVHKSFIINVNKMKKYVKEGNGCVMMNNNDSIEVSRRRSSLFRQFLNNNYNKFI